MGAFKESPVSDIINVGFVESLLKAHRQRTEDASFKLFNLLTLAFWMNSASHRTARVHPSADVLFPKLALLSETETDFV